MDEEIHNQLATEYATCIQRVLGLTHWAVARQIAYKFATQDAAIDVILSTMRHRRRDLYRARDRNDMHEAKSS